MCPLHTYTHTYTHTHTQAHRVQGLGLEFRVQGVVLRVNGVGAYTIYL